MHCLSDCYLLLLHIFIPLALLSHYPVCDDHHFKDEYLFFRFRNDEPAKRKQGTTKGKKRMGSLLNSSSVASDDVSSIGEGDYRYSVASYDSSNNSTENLPNESDTPPENDEE